MNKIDKVIKELAEVKAAMEKLDEREKALKSIISKEVEDKTHALETKYGNVSFMRVFAPYVYSAKTLKLKQEFETAKKIDEIKQQDREVISYSVRF